MKVAEKHNRRHPQTRLQQGIAAVELAVCLPLMVLFTFASIEMCSAVYLRQGLTIAAYEGVRVAVHPQGGTLETTTAAERILTERRISGGQVVLNPSVTEGLAPGTVIQVSVSAPVAANSLLRFGFFGSSRLTASCTMRKE